MRPVPKALGDAAQRWRHADQPAQKGSEWSRPAWQRWFPKEARLLSELPDAIDRATVIDVCRSSGNDPGQAVRGFLAAMIWGYGSVGYGPFRTARVVRENEGAAERLAQIAARARDEGGPAAFAWLAQHRLRHLGVAFATKYLFFCAASGSATPALVLDKLVRDWLAEHARWSLRLEWRVDDYRDYVETVCEWADELGLRADDVEMLMFTLAAGAARSRQWAQPELFGQARPSMSAHGTPDAARDVLDALDLTAEAFAALRETTGREDVEDFDRGLRRLRGIVLTPRSA